MDRHEFPVGEFDAGQRLDRFLTARLADQSRSRIQQLIKTEAVTVNGRVRPARHPLKPGDAVVISIPGAADSAVRAEDIPLDILFEDADMLVISKPAGLLVHPTPLTSSGTLVNALLHHCPDLSGIGGTRKPGIVHRLDRDTTGCLLAAKNDHAHRSLSAQFKNRTVFKEYTAFCWGTFAVETDRIITRLGRQRQQRMKMGNLESGGREAVSTYRVEAAYGPVSRAAVVIHTGRTHQIRVHMSTLGHPVVGDNDYGGGAAIIGQIVPEHRAKAKRCLKIMARQALHASRIAFEHPRTGTRMEYIAPLPADMLALEELLKS